VLTQRQQPRNATQSGQSTTSAANLTLKLVNKTGANLAPPVNLQLAAGQQQQRDVTQIFNLNPSDLIYGSLIIESSITGVVGDLSYSDPTGKLKFRAALPLESEPVKNFAFAHLDNRADTFTDVGIFNPGAQAARVEVRVLRADGTETGRATVQVPAGAHFSDFLDILVAASFGQLGGSFTLASDQPIVAAPPSDIGRPDARRNSRPQSFDPATFTRAAVTVLAASYKADLAPEAIVAAFGSGLATKVEWPLRCRCDDAGRDDGPGQRQRRSRTTGRCFSFRRVRSLPASAGTATGPRR